MYTLRIPIFLVASSLICVAQTFSSGSTGADGALDLTYGGDRVVQLPPSGILNYTTINIPEGYTLTFTKNFQNTPVIMLAQGTVNIGGTIQISGSSPAPGPGGYYGGQQNQPGIGPGAGQVEQSGSWVGPLSLVPIVGGSGGGGNSPSVCSLTGGGGGGAIVIASSTSVTIPSGGQIAANGGGAGRCGNDATYSGSGGGGAIRIVSNSINIGGTLNAAVVRLEAPTAAMTYTGSGTPPVVATINPTIVPTNAPTLTIVSIGGYPVPSYSGGTSASIDLLLPTQLQDPIPVIIQGSNVPVGSPVTISFSGSTGATSTTANLAGTTASSTATVSISGISRNLGNVTYLFASATFNANLLGENLKPNLPSELRKIELAAAPGKKTTYRFLREDGSEINVGKLPIDLRRWAGM